MVTVEHCLHWVKAFSAPHITNERAGGADGVGRGHGGDMAETADPTDQRDIPYHIVSYSEIKTRVLGLAGAALPRQSHCPSGGRYLEFFYRSCFSWVCFLFVAIVPFYLLNSLCFNPPILSFSPFLPSHPHPTGRRGKLEAVWF